MAPTPPTAADLVASPAAIGVDQAFTVKAKIGNAKDTRWTLKVTGTDCNFDHTIDETAVPDNQQQSGDLSIRVDPLDWTCLGEYTIQLDLTGPGGSAPPIQTPIKLVTDPSTKPSIESVTCTPPNPRSSDSVSCNAIETVAGSRGSWTWSVINADTDAVVVEPVSQDFKVPFNPTLPMRVTTPSSCKSASVASTDQEPADVRSTVTVLSIVGMSAANAKSELDAAGLTSSSVTTASHQKQGPGHCPVGCGQHVGPLRRPCADNSFHRPQCPCPSHRVAPTASWSTDAGSLAWNGNDGDSAGFALIRTNWSIVGGTTATFLETHPQWVPNGVIHGAFTLPQPILSGDHFKADISFRGGSVSGDVTFQVETISPSGVVTLRGSKSNKSSDDTILPFDVDLSPAVGATGIRLTVLAGPDSTQDWAAWVDPRVEIVPQMRLFERARLWRGRRSRAVPALSVRR